MIKYYHDSNICQNARLGLVHYIEGVLDKCMHAFWAKIAHTSLHNYERCNFMSQYWDTSLAYA